MMSWRHLLCCVVGATCGAVVGQECDVVYDTPGEQAGVIAAQIADPDGVSEFDLWVGDTISTDEDLTGITLSASGFCGNGCVDPFQVGGFVVRVYDGLPNDPEAELVLSSTDFGFDGIDTWSASLEEEVLPAGAYVFVYAAVNDFFVNGQWFSYTRESEEAGFAWSPFTDTVTLLFDGETPLVANATIEGCEAEGCLADCDGDGELTVLDFVCFQGLFQAGDASADCDGNGTLNVLDFVCFQGAFQGGCD